MPKKATKVATRRRAPARSVPGAAGGASLLERFRKEAESMQKQLRTNAERTLRELEKQLLRQVHAATEEQVERLEKRVSALEKAVEETDRRVRGLGVL